MLKRILYILSITVIITSIGWYILVVIFLIYTLLTEPIWDSVHSFLPNISTTTSNYIFTLSLLIYSVFGACIGFILGKKRGNIQPDKLLRALIIISLLIIAGYLALVAKGEINEKNRNYNEQVSKSREITSFEAKQLEYGINVSFSVSDGNKGEYGLQVFLDDVPSLQGEEAKALLFNQTLALSEAPEVVEKSFTVEDLQSSFTKALLSGKSLEGETISHFSQTPLTISLTLIKDAKNKSVDYAQTSTKQLPFQTDWYCINDMCGISGDIKFSESGDSLKVKETVPAEWQTYRNEEYGFEFKYPNDWYLRNNSQQTVSVISTNPDMGGNLAGFFLSVKSYPSIFTEATFLEKLEQEYLSYGHGDTIENKKALVPVVIAGVNAYKGVNDAATENLWPFYYFLYKDNAIIMIEAREDIGFPERKEREIMDQIFSTFRFVD